jgi:hypothetical protein
VLSERLVGGTPEIKVFNPLNPGDGFESVEADLEDVYFAQVFARQHAPLQEA